MKQEAQHPTDEERQELAISRFKGVDVGLGQADPLAGAAAKLSAQYPQHLIMIQAGKFLHAFDASAHTLATLKGYQLKLIGTTDEPHLRVGFPCANHKRRLWNVVQEFSIPYVVALGSQKDGYTVYISDQGNQASILAAVTPEIVSQVIEDLRQRGNLNTAAAKKMLVEPDTNGFKLKTQAQALDAQLLQDIIKMPRDLRATYGENLRACMADLMGDVFRFGLDADRHASLTRISGRIDLLKHYLAQAPRLSRLKFAFEHRAGLAVELGRLVGGLLRSSAKVTP
jgi:hypothetical protein